MVPEGYLADPRVTVIASLELACFIAYFLKGFSGFGPALVFVPVAAYLFSPASALASSALIDLVVGIGLAGGLRYGREELRRIAMIFPVMLAGTVAGGGLAGIVPERMLLALIAAVVLGFGIHTLTGRKEIPGRLPRGCEGSSRRRFLLWLGALAGGFSGGLVGISGPFLVMAARPGMDKDSFRKVMVAVFLLEGFARLLVYQTGSVGADDALRIAVTASPAVLAGLLLGARLHLRIGEIWFNRVVGGILVCVACQIVVQLAA